VFNVLDVVDWLDILVVLDDIYLIGVSWLLFILLALILFWLTTDEDYEEVSYLTDTKFNSLLLLLLIVKLLLLLLTTELLIGELLVLELLELFIFGLFITILLLLLLSVVSYLTGTNLV